jgi:hypothetical protein
VCSASCRTKEIEQEKAYAIFKTEWLGGFASLCYNKRTASLVNNEAHVWASHGGVSARIGTGFRPLGVSSQGNSLFLAFCQSNPGNWQTLFLDLFSVGKNKEIFFYICGDWA